LIFPVAFLGCTHSTRIGVAEADPVATIVISRHNYGFLWLCPRWFAIQKVDGRELDPRFREIAGLEGPEIKVAPGEREFVIRGRDACNMEIRIAQAVNLKANVEAGKNYKMNGVIRDNLFYVWLEDAKTKMKASSEASGPYTTTPIPIQLIAL
jgi:hypothetical protein